MERTEYLGNATAYNLTPAHVIQVDILKSGRVSDIQLWDHILPGKFNW